MGWIPEEWEIKQFKDVIQKIVGGGTPSKEKKDYWNGDIFWASVKDFANHNPDSTQDKITLKGLKKSSSNLIPRGTLITSTRMGLGKVVVFNVDVAINQDLKALFPKQELSKKYLKFYIQFNEDYINYLGTGSTVKGISLNEFNVIRIPLPPLAEQKKIAEILSTWDKAIEITQSYTIKLQVRKKGLMHQLLTGKKRLMGFSEEWEEVKLGDVGKIVTGNTPSTKDPENYGNDFCFVSPADISDKKYVTTTQKKLTNKGFKISRILPAYSVLFVCIGSTIGKIAMSKFELCTNQQINSIIVNVKNESDFIYYVLLHERNKIKLKSTEQAVPIINKTEFSMLKIYSPKCKKEQIAIAQILSKADEEIQQTQNYLTQLQQQKKGLMQQLLTGQKRVKLS